MRSVRQSIDRLMETEQTESSAPTIAAARLCPRQRLLLFNIGAYVFEKTAPTMTAARNTNIVD